MERVSLRCSDEGGAGESGCSHREEGHNASSRCALLPEWQDEVTFSLLCLTGLQQMLVIFLAS